MSGPIGVIVCAPTQTEGRLVQAINESEEFTVSRRCADLTEVRACARSSVAQCAIIDADDPDLDARIVEDLHAHHIGVIVLAPLADAPSLRALHADGIAQPNSPDGIVDSLRALGMSASFSPESGELPQTGEDASGRREAQIAHQKRSYAFADGDDELSDAQRSVDGTAEFGKIVCVWGPSGAPGRSTIAFNVAAGASASARVLLVDADTCAPSLAHMAGIAQDASGIAVLSRTAARTDVGADEIRGAAVPLTDSLDILTGITSPQRWREVSPAAVVSALSAARSLYDLIIVDVASATLDPVAPGNRHQGSRDDLVAAIVRSADAVMCVFRGDSLGINRLVDAYQWVGQIAPHVEPILVANHVSSSGAGPRPVNAIVQALAPVIPGRSIQLVPEDSRVSASLLHARAIVHAEPDQPIGQALAALTQVVLAVLPEHAA